jgi:hypothetical protein
MGWQHSHLSTWHWKIENTCKRGCQRWNSYYYIEKNKIKWGVPSPTEHSTHRIPFRATFIMPTTMRLQRSKNAFTHCIVHLQNMKEEVYRPWSQSVPTLVREGLHDRVTKLCITVTLESFDMRIRDFSKPNASMCKSGTGTNDNTFSSRSYGSHCHNSESMALCTRALGKTSLPWEHFDETTKCSTENAVHV